MKTHRMIPLLAALLAVCVTTIGVQAQSSKKETKASTAPAHPATLAATETETATATTLAVEAADSVVAPAETVHKKHGGLFGKMKGVAKNKMVQQVAKVAACTMVPGGQLVAGAIDAASNKGAAGAAQGVAGAASGSSCMPGMGGAAGMAGGMTGTGATMGLTATQLAGLHPGGAGNAASQAMIMAQMQQMQQMMSTQKAAGLGAMTEAPGQTVDVSTDLAAELGKGKTSLRNIDWIAGAPGISPAGTPGFTQAMTQLAAAMGQAGGSYRLDLYLDDRYEDAIVKTLGPERLSTVEAALSDALGGAQSTAKIEIGKAKKDKHPRLEVVKRK
jgi:hypothetical protein